MSNRKSSIEWLIEHFGGIENCTPDFRYKIEQAKEMHKQEIENAFNDGENNSVDYFVPGNRIKECEQYYNETFGK